MISVGANLPDSQLLQQFDSVGKLPHDSCLATASAGHRRQNNTHQHPVGNSGGWSSVLTNENDLAELNQTCLIEALWLCYVSSQGPREDGLLLVSRSSVSSFAASAALIKCSACDNRADCLARGSLTGQANLRMLS